MTRKPPEHVLKALRAEVGYGCPVDECSSPYLEWHHFDPPFHIEEHHRPEGMIALCRHHHLAADGGAYSNEQLRAFKENRAQAARIRGKFEWLRNKLLAVVGGSIYYEIYKILSINGHDVVSLERDEDGYLRLSIKMLSLTNENRAVIENNVWLNIGTPEDLRCPPGGKELLISYKNGDYLFVRFEEIPNAETAYKKYKNHCLQSPNSSIEYPITAVEINYKIGGTSYELTPAGSTFGSMTMTGGFTSHCERGVLIENDGLIFRQKRHDTPVLRLVR